MKPFRTAVVVGALAASAALAGCGGSSNTPSTTGSEPVDGKAIFSDSCGGCHALAAAGTSGGSGPELTTIKLTADEVAAQVRSGGGGMPSFDGDLSEEQITAVAEFVAQNDGS